MITFLRKPGGQIDERVSVSKRVKPSDKQTCNVIVDYGSKKVEKCVIEGKALDMEFEKLNEYYKRIYPALIHQLEREAPITTKTKGA